MKSDVYQQLVLLMCHFNCSSENMIHLWYIIHNINNYIAYQHSGMAEGLLGYVGLYNHENDQKII